MSLIKDIADYIVEEGTTNSLSGNWIVYLEDLENKGFNISSNWLIENRVELGNELYRRPEIADVYIDTQMNKENIDVTLILKYCKMNITRPTFNLDDLIF